jgi:hypothetical protein
MRPSGPGAPPHDYSGHPLVRSLSFLRVKKIVQPVQPGGFPVSDPFSNDKQPTDRPAQESESANSLASGFGVKMRPVDLPGEAEEPAPPPGRYPRWLSLFYLYFRPKIFFRYFVRSESALIVTLCVFTFGVSSTIDRIESRTILQKTPEVFLTSWASYWAMVLVGGVIGGALLYLIGGWWYRVRIGWSGAHNPDGDLARRIYVYTAQIVAIPLIIVTVWETIHFPNPTASFYAEGSVWYFLLLAFPFWAIWISFRGVLQVFQTRLVPSLLWFLILPGLLNGAGLVVLFAASLMNSAAEPPNLDYTKSFTSDVFTFSYPGNWWIVDDDWYDPNGYVEVEPPQDAKVRLMLYDSEDTLEQEMNLTEDRFYEGLEQVERLEDFSQWGNYAGVGRSYRMSAEGIGLSVRIFILPVAEGFYLEVQEFVARDVEADVKPGFDLVRKSFRLKVGADEDGELILDNP